MKRGETKKKIAFYSVAVLIFLLSVSILTGCSALLPKNDINADKKEIVDSFAQVALLYDRDSAKYDEVLKAVGDCLAGTLSVQKTCEIVESMLNEIQAECDNVTYNELSEEFKTLLDENDVIAEEYVIYANQRADKLSIRVDDINSLLYYIKESDKSDEMKNNLSFIYDNYVKMQAAECGYEFYSINYWFANWNEESVKLVKKEVLDKLTSFNKDNLPWITSREQSEDELTLCVDKMQECAESLERYYADRKNELDAIRRG